MSTASLRAVTQFSFNDPLQIVRNQLLQIVMRIKEKEKENDEKTTSETITWFNASSAYAVALLYLLLKKLCGKNLRFQEKFLHSMTYSERIKLNLLKATKGDASKFAIPKTFTVDSACLTFAKVYTSPIITFSIFCFGILIPMAREAYLQKDKEVNERLDNLETQPSLTNKVIKDFKELQEEKAKEFEDAINKAIKDIAINIKDTRKELATKSTKWWWWW